MLGQLGADVRSLARSLPRPAISSLPTGTGVQCSTVLAVGCTESRLLLGAPTNSYDGTAKDLVNQHSHDGDQLSDTPYLGFTSQGGTPKQQTAKWIWAAPSQINQQSVSAIDLPHKRSHKRSTTQARRRRRRWRPCVPRRRNFELLLGDLLMGGCCALPCTGASGAGCTCVPDRQRQHQHGMPTVRQTAPAATQDCR